MKDPLNGYRFWVEIEGILEGYFTECSGFETKLDIEEYKEGGQNAYVHKLPGRRSYTNITLKRGMISSVELWGWLHRFSNQKAKSKEKKNISIIMHDGQGQQRLRWDLTAAYPVKWTSPTLQTDQSNAMLESLELAYQEFEFIKK